jgi:hypothetical protein
MLSALSDRAVVKVLPQFSILLQVNEYGGFVSTIVD